MIFNVLQMVTSSRPVARKSIANPAKKKIDDFEIGSG